MTQQQTRPAPPLVRSTRARQGGDMRRLAAARFAQLSGRGLGARLFGAALSVLAQGRPVVVDELATATGGPAGRVLGELRRVEGTEWDDQGRVVGVGITLNPTPYRVEVNGHRVYAWCAEAALGLLPALGHRVTVSSPCHASGRPITVVCDPDGVVGIDPPGAAVSLILAGDTGNIRLSACAHIHFFAAPDAATGWLAEHHDSGALVPVADGYRYGVALARLLLADPPATEPATPLAHRPTRASSP